LLDKLNDNLQKTLHKGQVKLSRPAGCSSVSLYLFDPNVLEGPLSHDEAQAVVAAPAYWSFCWASGQVLAQYIIDHPEHVANKTVIDFGSGSGIVAIAAALSGAKAVYACDIDQDALDAVAVNAHANNVHLNTCRNLDDIEEEIDLVTAADVLYDKDNYSLLDLFVTRSKRTILADSRVRHLPSENYQLTQTVQARTWPDLNEFEEFNQVRIYQSLS